MRRPGTLGLALAVLLAIPALVGLGYALAAAVGWAGVGGAGFDPGRVVRVLGERTTWRALAFSLWLAGGSTMLAAAAALVVALAFRGQARADKLARTMAVLPLTVPHLVAAVAGVLILSQSGLLARGLHAVGLIAAPGGMPPLVYDRAGLGVILSLAWKEFPFLALVAFTLLAQQGRALDDAARTLGADTRATLRYVTLPLLWRGLRPAAIAAFVFVAGNYEATRLLAPSDPLALPLLTYERYTDPALARHPDAFVLVFVALLLSIGAVVWHEWARGRAEALNP